MRDLGIGLSLSGALIRRLPERDSGMRTTIFLHESVIIDVELQVRKLLHNRQKQVVQFGPAGLTEDGIAIGILVQLQLITEMLDCREHVVVTVYQDIHWFIIVEPLGHPTLDRLLEVRKVVTSLLLAFHYLEKGLRFEPKEHAFLGKLSDRVCSVSEFLIPDLLKSSDKRLCHFSKWLGRV